MGSPSLSTLTLSIGPVPLYTPSSVNPTSSTWLAVTVGSTTLTGPGAFVQSVIAGAPAGSISGVPLPTDLDSIANLIASAEGSSFLSTNSLPSGGPSVTNPSSSATITTGPSTAQSSTGSSTPTSTSSPTISQSSTNNSLLGATIALAVIAGIAILALAFVLFRSRRRKYAPAASSDKDLTYDPAVVELKDKVANLQNDLKSKDTNLREAQGALLASGRGAGAAAVMDDKTVNGRFARLRTEINDWVVTHFKNARPAANPPRELTSTLIRTQSNYSFLLQEPRTRFILLRAIAAEYIADAMNDGSLLGNPEFAQMQQSMSSHTTDPAQFAQWRALTASIFPTNSPAQTEAASTLAQRIDYSTSTLVNAPASDARLSSLQRIVQSAQQLAVDLAKQRPNFTFERPQGSMFDPAVMDDVLQEKRGEDLKGKKVQSVVFPAVFRHGNSEGTGYGQRTVISKAAVLV